MDGNILILCRDESCCYQLMGSLSGKGLNLHSVDEEADLLLELLEGAYSVVIYDMEQARLDGLKTVKILKRIRPKVALIVLSDDESTTLGGQILQEGVSYYSVKPLQMDRIEQAIFSALDKGN